MDIYSSLDEIKSDLHYHQQDLSAIRDDLGALKFGFALLQDAISDLSADSKRFKYALEHLLSIIDDFNFPSFP